MSTHQIYLALFFVQPKTQKTEGISSPCLSIRDLRCFSNRKKPVFVCFVCYLHSPHLGGMRHILFSVIIHQADGLFFVEYQLESKRYTLKHLLIWKSRKLGPFLISCDSFEKQEKYFQRGTSNLGTYVSLEYESLEFCPDQQHPVEIGLCQHQPLCPGFSERDVWGPTFLLVFSFKKSKQNNKYLID